ncbi:MAG: enoyl-CoA hydratase/isomerase family protein [Actinobacteria bacterium]|nr:enoyl-CoA hydratase/isomerase family protein [Actinomycetota bacterium]
MKFRREDGILEARLHTDDGPFQWGLDAQRGLISVMFDINNDPETECLIITGTGTSFLDEKFNDEDWRRHGLKGPFTSAQGYDIFYYVQTREPSAFINMNIPVIAAVNGPSVIHAEIALLNDIVICSEETYFSDAHWAGMGIVPGDGVHIFWRELLGPNRGKHFLLTGQKIEAQEALQLGIVGEVLPLDKLNDRAWEIARDVFMNKDRIQRRLTKGLLAQPWKELFAKEQASGLAHESLACMEHWPLDETAS